VKQDAVSNCAHRWVSDADAAGRLLGAWRTEIGELSRIIVMRSFETMDELQHDRNRALTSEQPFGIESACVQFTMESYALFPSCRISSRRRPLAASTKFAVIG
jgi:hypothetical protein